MRNKYLKAAVMMVAVLALGMPVLSAQGNGQAPAKKQAAVRDSNGDGICDITGQPVGTAAQNGQKAANKNGKRMGPGDGTGNQGGRPQDGTGWGSQSGSRTGPRDGSGAGQSRPVNSQRRGGRRG